MLLVIVIRNKQHKSSRSIHKQLTYVDKSYLYLSLSALIMSFGPVVKILGRSIKLLSFPIPLPYTFFYFLVPGFNGFRTPSRWIVLFSLALTLICYIALSHITRRRLLLNLAAIVIPFAVFFENKLPFKSYPINPTPPAIYQQVAALPPSSAIIELPILLWNQPAAPLESLRSLYSLIHGHRRFNGYSGFAPQAWIDLTQSVQSKGLTKENIAKLKSLGITHVLAAGSLTPL